MNCRRASCWRRRSSSSRWCGSTRPTRRCARRSACARPRSRERSSSRPRPARGSARRCRRVDDLDRQALALRRPRGAREHGASSLGVVAPPGPRARRLRRHPAGARGLLPGLALRRAQRARGSASARIGRRRRRGSTALALVATAVLFAVFSLDWRSMPTALVLGLALGLAARAHGQPRRPGGRPPGLLVRRGHPDPPRSRPAADVTYPARWMPERRDGRRGAGPRPPSDGGLVPVERAHARRPRSHDGVQSSPAPEHDTSPFRLTRRARFWSARTRRGSAGAVRAEERLDERERTFAARR